MNGVGPSLLERAAPAALLRWEAPLVCLVAWVFFLSITLSLGEIGLSWDTLNHHIYLGWTADQHRFDRDFLGAGYQSFSFPYLYWPAYKMAVSGWSGAETGAVLATLHVVVVVPVWMIARTCMPGDTVFDALMRGLSVALGLLSSVALSAFGTTMIDMLAAAPLIWAVSFALKAAAGTGCVASTAHQRHVALSGLCAGLAVAAKLSNGPLAVLMPALWWMCAPKLGGRIYAVLLGSSCTVAGFVLAYGYWGWLLWRYFGNPVHPFYDHWFAPLRAWTGWAG